MTRRGSRRPAATVVGLSLALGMLVGCGSDGSCQDFAVSLARATGGASSAVAAAEALAAQGGFDMPDDGWRDGDRDDAGQQVVSGRAVLHAVRGTDGSWFIDSGRCV